jgi:hypothetical protein
VDRVVLELALISGIACVGLGMAWAHEANFFAIVFAAGSGDCHRRSSSAVFVSYVTCNPSHRNVA